MGSLKEIMTNFEGDNDPNWSPFVDFIPPPEHFNLLKEIPRVGNYIFALFYALRLYRVRGKYKVILLACDTAGMIFGFLQFFLFFNKKPVFYFSNLWEVHPNKLFYYFKYLQIWIINRVSIGFSVNSTCDALSYSSIFPININKFVCLPYFPTLWKYSYTISDDNFVFSGGNGQREYHQLIEAAKELPYNFFIACSDDNLFKGLDIPANVKVQSVSHQRFREMMASATIHVVALAGGFLRSGGHQTYLNAMAMEKPTIVTDCRGAIDYIEDGVDGILIEPGDIKSLRNTIDKLMKDRKLRKFIGANAKRKSEQFNGSVYLKNLRLIAMKKYEKSKN
ncbi:MAG: glycosyltransferase [Candidatus Electrothrix communis]|nr:MAG: glycosyltransferase [Candidatus Electrothrix communis]